MKLRSNANMHFNVVYFLEKNKYFDNFFFRERTKLGLNIQTLQFRNNNKHDGLD